jgi:hypothetical protein
MLHQRAEVAIALATYPDESDPDELAWVLATNRFGAVKENIWTGNPKTGDDGSVAGSAKKFAARKGTDFWHEPFMARNLGANSDRQAKGSGNNSLPAPGRRFLRFRPGNTR